MKTSYKQSALLSFGLFCSILVALETYARMTEPEGSSHPPWLSCYYSGSKVDRSKTESERRVLYLSNSHAQTGGGIVSHLQALADRLEPGRVEFVNFASPGMFATEFYLRYLSVEDHEFDAVVLQPAYISFSPRMNIRRQAHSVRQYMQPWIVGKLDGGFLFRHWDIQLHFELALSSYLEGFAERERMYASAIAPVTGRMREIHHEDRIATLEVDVDQRWRFPEGFDQDLFDWSLYAGEPWKHYRDWEQLMAAVSAGPGEVWVANLPIAEGWSRHDIVADQYEGYQEALEVRSAGAHYENYETWWPAELSAYDPLHPTVPGSILSAWDVLLRFRNDAPGFFSGGVTDKQLLAVLDESLEHWLDAWRLAWATGEGLDEVSRHEAWTSPDLTDLPQMARLVRSVREGSALESSQGRAGLFALGATLEQTRQVRANVSREIPETIPMHEMRAQGFDLLHRAVEAHDQLLRRELSRHLSSNPARQPYLALLEACWVPAQEWNEQRFDDSGRKRLWKTGVADKGRRVDLYTDVGRNRPFQIRVHEADGSVVFLTDILLDGSFLHVWRFHRDLPRFWPSGYEPTAFLAAPEPDSET